MPNDEHELFIGSLTDLIRDCLEFIPHPDEDEGETEHKTTADYYRWCADRAERQKNTHLRIKNVIEHGRPNGQNYD